MGEDQRLLVLEGRVGSSGLAGGRLMAILL
jgi:hypothetical protein